MKIRTHSLPIVAHSSAGLGVLVSFSVLGSGMMVIFGDSYPLIAAVLFAFLLIGGAVTIFDLGVILRTVRSWSWKNVMMVGLALYNVALTGILVVLFRYFSQPIVGTGSP